MRTVLYFSCIVNSTEINFASLLICVSIGQVYVEMVSALLAPSSELKLGWILLF